MSDLLRNAVASAIAGETPEPEMEKHVVRKDSPYFPTRKKLPTFVPGTLASLKVVPVLPNHKHAPSRGRFNVEGDTLYVLKADWPKLKEALERQRAKAESELRAPK